jgi:hypothetical protein
VLVHRSACLADKTSEPPERNPLVQVDPRYGQVDPFWRREIRPAGQPRVQGGLVKVLLSNPAAMTVAVSLWLNGGVSPTEIAKRAGHSVEVLLRVYAKCVSGQEEIANRRIEEILGPGDGDVVDDMAA